MSRNRIEWVTLELSCGNNNHCSLARTADTHAADYWFFYCQALGRRFFAPIWRHRRVKDTRTWSDSFSFNCNRQLSSGTVDRSGVSMATTRIHRLWHDTHLIRLFFPFKTERFSVFVVHNALSSALIAALLWSMRDRNALFVLWMVWYCM